MLWEFKFNNIAPVRVLYRPGTKPQRGYCLINTQLAISYYYTETLAGKIKGGRLNSSVIEFIKVTINLAHGVTESISCAIIWDYTNADNFFGHSIVFVPPLTRKRLLNSIRNNSRAKLTLGIPHLKRDMRGVGAFDKELGLSRDSSFHISGHAINVYRGSLGSYRP